MMVQSNSPGFKGFKGNSGDIGEPGPMGRLLETHKHDRSKHRLEKISID